MCVCVSVCECECECECECVCVCVCACESVEYYVIVLAGSLLEMTCKQPCCFHTKKHHQSMFSLFSVYYYIIMHNVVPP